MFPRQTEVNFGVMFPHQTKVNFDVDKFNITLCMERRHFLLCNYLFLILINDLPNASILFTILFTDDTTLQYLSEILKNSNLTILPT